MKILSLESTPLSAVVSQTVETLASGGLVIFPSDTVYGLLVDAQNESAVDRAIAFKNRPPGKAISVFVPTRADVDAVGVVREDIRATLSRLLPGPFTLVLDSRGTVSSRLESERKSMGIRVPDYHPIQALMRAYGKPVTATSANLGGKHPHYSISSLLRQLPRAKQDMIDLIVDAGKLPRNKPSTVIDLTSDTVKILRRGDVPWISTKEYRSRSSKETRAIGKHLVASLARRAGGKPLVLVLQGDLGTGKTEMTRGIAASWGLDRIVSPTYVVSYEYPIVPSDQNPASHYHVFVHSDLYMVTDQEEFAHLGFEQYLERPSIMVFEWGERLGDLFHAWRDRAVRAYVQIRHIDENERGISISESID